MVCFLFVELGSLTTANLMEKVRGLQNLAYQLGLEECEYMRNTYLGQWLFSEANICSYNRESRVSSYLMSPLDGDRGFHYMLVSHCFLVGVLRFKNTVADCLFM